MISIINGSNGKYVILAIATIAIFAMHYGYEPIVTLGETKIALSKA
jgi:hypothetical protein